jgi:hypothetical protein
MVPSDSVEVTVPVPMVRTGSVLQQQQAANGFPEDEDASG